MTTHRQAVEEITANPKDRLVSHEVLFTVNKTSAKVHGILNRMPLEEVLKPCGSLPGVASTRMMRGDEFGEVGSRRLVRLTNEHTLVEEVLDNQPGSTFTYRVWNSSMPQTRPVEYAVGQFWFLPQNESTMIRWRYSFKLRKGHFPGLLGGFGRFLFKTWFVSPQWAPFMAQATTCIKRYVESAR